MKDWNSKVKINDLDEIRYFLKEVTASGISISECVKGYRTFQILKSFEINDDSEEWIDEEDNNDGSDETNDILNSKFHDKASKENLVKNSDNKSHSKYNKKVDIIKENYTISDFVDEIYRKCNSLGIRPSIIVGWIQDLFNIFSFDDYDGYKINDYTIENESQSTKKVIQKGNNTLITKNKTSIDIPYISQVSFFIQRKKNHVKQLDNLKKSMLEDLAKITFRKNKLSSELEEVIKKRKEVYSYFNWYESLRKELFDKQKIVLRHNINNIVNTISEFKNFEYDVTKIIKEYDESNSLVIKKKNIESEIKYILNKKQELETKNSELEESAGYYSQTIKIYNEIHKHGIGLKELKVLANLIYECAHSNGTDLSDSIRKFFRDIETQYDNKLGFEKTIEDLKKEKQRLEDEVPEYKSHLSMIGIASTTLVQLHRNGVTNQDIIGMNNLFLDFKNSDFLTDPFQYAIVTKNNSNKRTWELFIDKLKTLRNINLEIHNRISIIERLSNEMIEKGKKKDALEFAYQNTISIYNTLIYKIFEIVEVIKKMNEKGNPTPIIFLLFLNFDQSGDKDSNQKK